tara:strand:- start:110 stop:730 length:621 start_codon:yes stop_codon:yes gene_type:complete
MLVVRLVHLKGMPSYEDVLESLKKNNLSQTEANSNVIIDGENDKKFSLNETEEIANISKDQIKNTTQTKPILSSLNPKSLPKNIIGENVSSFEELILLSSKKKEVQLKYDLENNVNLIKFSKGKIDISFNENLDKNFVRNLSQKLLEWTGIRWVITLTKKMGQKTFSELQSIKKKELLDQEKKGEVYKQFKDIFSDGELLEVKKED